MTLSCTSGRLANSLPEPRWWLLHQRAKARSSPAGGMSTPIRRSAPSAHKHGGEVPGRSLAILWAAARNVQMLDCPRCGTPLDVVGSNLRWRGYLACRECWLAFSFCSGRLEQGRFRPPGFLIPWEDELCSTSVTAGRENAQTTIATIQHEMARARLRAVARRVRFSSASVKLTG